MDIVINDENNEHNENNEDNEVNEELNEVLENVWSQVQNMDEENNSLYSNNNNMLENINNNFFTNLYNNSYNYTNNNSNFLESVLNESFNEKPKFKNIISEKGKNTLKKEIYNPEKCETNHVCPIYQIAFTNGMEIIRLPCNHIFIPKGIETWLGKEQAICPVCRFKLDSIEVKNEEKNSNYIAENVINSTSFLNSLRRSYSPSLNNPSWNRNYNSLNANTRNSSFSNYIFRDILNQMINDYDEEEVQSAILNSFSE